MTVGEPYPFTERVELESCVFSPASAQILLVMSGIMAVERTALEGELSFALATHEGIPVLMMQPDATPGWWVTMPLPFIEGESAESYLLSDGLGEGEHQLVFLTLVEKITGVVEGLRAMTWSPLFSQAVEAALSEAVMAGPLSQAEALRRIDEMNKRYPTVESLVLSASHRTRAGQ